MYETLVFQPSNSMNKPNFYLDNTQIQKITPAGIKTKVRDFLENHKYFLNSGARTWVGCDYICNWISFERKLFDIHGL